MQIDFKKENILTGTLRGPQSKMIMVEGDVIVPDVKPDIKEILLAEARAVLTEQNLSGDGLNLAGTVIADILYIPEGDVSNPKAMESRFDFKDSLKFAGEEGLEISGKATVQQVEFSLINSRKLHVKVTVSISARGNVKREVTLLTDVDAESPVQVQKKPISAYQIVADRVADIAISELLEIPGAKPDAEDITKLDVKAFKGECKIMSGRILLKGTLSVHTIYEPVSEEAGIESMEHEVPFTEILEVEGLNDDCLCHVSYEVKDVFCSLGEDMNRDMRILSLDVVLRAHVMASKTCSFNVIDDCYSLAGKEEISRARVAMDELLCEGVSHLNVKEILAVPESSPAIGGIYSLECIPKVTEIQMADEKMIIRGQVTAVVLYGCAEEHLPVRSLTSEIGFEHSVPVDGADESVFCECGVTDQNVSFTLNAASELELRCVLEFYTRAVRKLELDLVSGCELTETEEETERRRGIVIYFAQKGDTLWNVAKRYRTDKHGIMKLNCMEEERLIPGQKLLIPGR